MKIYLASRYSRREEMLRYAAELEARGHEVTSRWITGCHEIPGRSEVVTDGAMAYKTEERSRIAREDVNDLFAADCVIAFTEAPGSDASRGGRHVEFGVALAIEMRLIVVGHRENVFHCLPEVEYFETFEDFMKCLRI